MRHRGQFPWWGDPRTPRYHGPLGCLFRKGKAAHGPRHPAVQIPPRLVGFVSGSLLGFHGMDVGYAIWGFVSGVRTLFELVPLKDLTPVSQMFVVPSLSLVFGISVGVVFFFFFSLSLSLSFYLSLRCWGNPNPFWGLGFPLCLFILATHCVFHPYVMLYSYT